MDIHGNHYTDALKRSWLSIGIWALVFFAATFAFLSFQKQRYEMTIIIPSALEAFSFDSSSLTELTRQYISGAFNGGILVDLKNKYGKNWESYRSIPKSDLVITQRGNIYIIHARATESEMARQLGETMANFIAKTKGVDGLDLHEKLTDYTKMRKNLGTELSESSMLLQDSKKSGNLTNTIGFYAARQSNASSFLTLEQLSLQLEKYVQIDDYLSKAKKVNPYPISNQRFINSLLFGFLGMLLGSILALSKHSKQQ